MKKRKSNFLLLEVMISCSLLALILGALFFWYYKLAKEKKDIEERLKPLAEERYCDIRLERVLPKIKKDIFFTKNGELFFIFDNGTRLDPFLSDAVLGSLYYDENERSLSLTIWPHPKHLKKEPKQTWILLKNVSDVDFSFYNPPLTKHVVDPEKVTKSSPLKGWQSEWQKEFEMLPAFIKLTLKRSDHIYTYVFGIEEGKPPIIYWRS